MSMERRKTVNHGVGADFSRTCEGCSCITVETVEGLPPMYRCGGPRPGPGLLSKRKGPLPAICARLVPADGRKSEKIGGSHNANYEIA